MEHPVIRLIAEDHVQVDTILYQILSIRNGGFPNDTGRKSVRQLDATTQSNRDEIGTGHAASTQVKETVSFTDRIGQTVITTRGVVIPVDFTNRCKPVRDVVVKVLLPEEEPPSSSCCSKGPKAPCW